MTASSPRADDEDSTWECVGGSDGNVCGEPRDYEMTRPAEVSARAMRALSAADAQIVENYRGWNQKQLKNECRKYGLEVSGANLLRALALTGARAYPEATGRRTAPQLFPEDIREEIEALVEHNHRYALQQVSMWRGLPNSRTKVGLAVYLATNKQRLCWHPDHAVDRHARSARAPCRGDTDRSGTAGKAATSGLNDHAPSFGSPFAHVSSAAWSGALIMASMATTPALGWMYATTTWLHTVVEGGVEAIGEVTAATRQFVLQVGRTSGRMLES